MIFYWYRISYSRFELPLLAFIAADEQTDDATESKVEGWLFAADDEREAPLGFRAFTHAAPDMRYTLVEAVKVEFLETAYHLAKRNRFPVDEIEMKMSNNIYEQIRAWQTAGMYKSISFAAEKTQKFEIESELRSLGPLAIVQDHHN